MVNKNVNFESNDEEKISQMLGGLNRVGAPNDFDFRVRARIAAGKPEGIPGFKIPAAVRYAVPLVLLLAVGAYFGFNAYYSLNNANVPTVAVTQPEKVQPVIPQTVDDEIVVPPAATKDERAGGKSPDAVNVVPRTVSGANVNRKSESLEKSPGGGMLDMGSKISPVILAKGLNSNGRAPGKPRDFETTVQVSAKEVLNLLGIEANYSGSNWKVIAIKEHSAAERSGLKAGDVVEAINNQRLDERTSFGNRFSGKSLLVMRDGKPIQIDLK